jgi:hypothetical protein
MKSFKAFLTEAQLGDPWQQKAGSLVDLNALGLTQQEAMNATYFAVSLHAKEHGFGGDMGLASVVVNYQVKDYGNLTSWIRQGIDIWKLYKETQEIHFTPRQLKAEELTQEEQDAYLSGKYDKLFKAIAAEVKELKAHVLSNSDLMQSIYDKLKIPGGMTKKLVKGKDFISGKSNAGVLVKNDKIQIDFTDDGITTLGLMASPNFYCRIDKKWQRVLDDRHLGVWTTFTQDQDVNAILKISIKQAQEAYDADVSENVFKFSGGWRVLLEPLGLKDNGEIMIDFKTKEEAVKYYAVMAQKRKK